MARSSLGAHGGIWKECASFFLYSFREMHSMVGRCRKPALDGGGTLEKRGMILDHIKGDNRDPKVFYHKESAAYIMTLFLCCPAN